MSKRIIILIVSALTLTLAPLQAKPSLTVEPKLEAGYGGTLRIGYYYKPTAINPLLTNHGLSADIMTLVFDRLVQFDATGEIEGNLASSWKISPDGLTYTFYLHKGVKFHDGVALTAEDVCYTYQTIKDPSTNSPFAKDFSIVDKFEAMDPYTFRILLKKPTASFIYSLRREIVPKHLYVGADIRSGSFNFRPVGTGAFQFQEWTKDDQISLIANPAYFGGRPYLDKVVYKTYPGKTEAWAALLRGEVDMVSFMNIEDYELTKIDSQFKAYAVPIPDYYMVSYNIKDPFLEDLRVRQAIAFAVNREDIIKTVEKGYGVESVGPFYKTSWAFNSKVRSFSYNPLEALRLLKEAGWEDGNQDGILEKNDKWFILRMMVDSKNDKMKKMAMLIRQQLQEIGIRIEIVLYENESEMEKYEKTCQARLTLLPGSAVDPNETSKLWHSTNDRKGGIWTHNELSAEVDDLINLGRNTHDRNKRPQIYRRLHKVIYDEQPACFLYFPYVFHAVSKNFGGTDAFFNSVEEPIYSLKNIYFKQENIKRR